MEVIAESGLSPQQVCYIGDDLPDVPIMKRVGWAVAVADAGKEVRQCAHFTTRHPGGYGAVREVVEVLLRAKSLWDDLIARYLE
jgi:YrbI family 3-deoxy-D-manno-octulosonate 8-phosphate phosphatase